MLTIVEIPLQEILLATNNFAKENLIASGGYGPVYQGKSEKHGTIAVKRLDPKNGQGDIEFRREIALISEYKHENIVFLVGFCDESEEKILVYKLESNGSLDKHLSNKHLSWIQRLLICLDAAQGLKYLHDDVGPQQRILHRDVKSANILLDEKWNAKISDFGLSRIGPANVQTTLLISNACGTFGYIDPEYLHTGCLTQRSNVYSFGVVLFEVLCGRPTCVRTYKDECQFLTVLVYKHYARIIPFYLLNQINKASLDTFSTIAYQCLKNGIERPTMNVVLQQLQKALDCQLAPTIGASPDDGGYGDDQVAPLANTLPVNMLIHERPIRDWNCGSCNNLNFQTRDSCARCGQGRLGGGRGIIGGGGIVSPDAFGLTVRGDDWYCNVANCGRHNFARRSTCFKCGNPKAGA